MSPQWTFHNCRMTYADLGFLPLMLDVNSPLPAQEQLNSGYAHGGGFQPFTGFELLSDNTIKYPGDPVLFPLASCKLKDELIVFHPHSWVAIIQPNRSFVIARMD